MSSISKVLYIGITNNIVRRVYEHKTKLVEGFSSKYNCDQLVYFEEYCQVQEAIEREKQLKKWNRAKKMHIIATKNPNWCDLSIEISRLRSR
jgi:putative endonuclease